MALEHPSELAPGSLQEVQRHVGYHPAGYGFYNFKTEKINAGYLHTWQCANSCD
jgi:hypothetical protein